MIPVGSYCSSVPLLTVCLEPAMLVQAFLQHDAHFHTFLIKILQSGLRVPLLFSVHLGESFFILLWIFEKKHCCSLLYSRLQIKYLMTSHMRRGRRSLVSQGRSHSAVLPSDRNGGSSCPVLTRNSAGFLWWRLLPHAAGHPLLLTHRRCLNFTAVRRFGLLRYFSCALGTLLPLIHLFFCCVALADFQMSLTQALSPLRGFLNHSWLFAVGRASPTFLDVFSQPSCRFLL